MPYVDFSLVKKGKKTKVFADRRLINEYATVKTNFDRLTFTTPITLDELRKHTFCAVDDLTLMQNTNLMLLLNVGKDKLPQLFRASVLLGAALNLGAKKAIDALGKGLARQSRLILDNIGIVFKQEDANEWYRSQTTKVFDQRTAWIDYAIHRIILQSKGIVINPEQITRQRYYADVKNAQCGVER